MRDIKFRGKRIDTGEWVYGYYDVHQINHGIWTREGTEFPEWHQIEPESVGQLTGLKDKSGKDDYIGDLIRVFVPRDKGVGYELKGIAEIIYNDAYSKTEFIYRTGDFVGNTFDGYELIECYKHENIGNIFQSPELLNPLN